MNNYARPPTYAENDVIRSPGNAFRVLSALGLGGMGEVYLVLDQALGSKRVMKILRRDVARAQPNLRDRFIDEARVLTRISHPNVVRCLSLDRTMNEEPFYLMEHLHGLSLYQLLSGRKSNVARSLDVTRSILSGLHAIAEAGVIHRDIKPANVLLHRDADEVHVRIIDFGVIKLVEDGPDDTHFCGTASYAAPEQLLARGVTPKADVFAAGCILFELLTGVHPYDAYGRGVEQVIRRVRVPAPALSDYGEYPSAVVQLVAALLDLDPERRMGAQAAARTIGVITRDLPGFAVDRQITAHNVLKDPAHERRPITKEELNSATLADGLDLWWQTGSTLLDGLEIMPPTQRHPGATPQSPAARTVYGAAPFAPAPVVQAPAPAAIPAPAPAPVPVPAVPARAPGALPAPAQAPAPSPVPQWQRTMAMAQPSVEVRPSAPSSLERTLGLPGMSLDVSRPMAPPPMPHPSIQTTYPAHSSPPGALPPVQLNLVPPSDRHVLPGDLGAAQRSPPETVRTPRGKSGSKAAIAIIVAVVAFCVVGALGALALRRYGRHASP